MGVKQLETFVMKDVRGGIKTISIKDECEMFKSKTGNRPTLIIDMMGIFHLISHDKIVELCGGQHNEYRKAVEDLFQKLSVHADLVFFEEGPTPDEKLKACNKRRNERYAKAIRIIDKINDEVPLSIITESSKWGLVWAPTYLNLLEEMAKKYGKLYVALSKECDTELARYACNNPSTLAVVADDSDFLIFEGNWRYFSFKHLNVRTMKTKEYSRSALRRCLNLTDDQMKILSTLAGNDLITTNKGFLQRIGCFQNKFPNLANFIKRHLPKDRNSMVEAIAENIFESKSQVHKDRVEHSLNLYNINYEVEDYSESNPILHLCISKYFDFSYRVLQRLADNFSLIYYDMREGSVDSYVESILDLFAKQIGILLQHKRNEPDGIKITTCAKTSHGEGYKKLQVSPVYPEHQVPDLMEFLNRQDYPELDDLRFDLLKWMISDKLLASHDLTVIPKKYLLDVITLCFMVDKKLLSVTEADLILYTIKNVENGSIVNDIQPPHVVNPRAFKLSFLFVKVSITIQRCFEVVGLKDTLMKIINFDGVFFHVAYLNFVNCRFKPTDELAGLEDFRLYK